MVFRGRKTAPGKECHVVTTTHRPFSMLVVWAAFAAIAVAQNEDRPSTPRPSLQSNHGGVMLAKPSNPDAVKGTWVVGGVKRQLTEGEFYKLHLMLTKLEGTAQQGISTARVWEYILIREEADALGVDVSGEEVDEALQRNDKDMYQGLLRRWETLGVTEAEGIEYFRNSKKADRLRDLYLNTTRLSTKEAFDLFKQGRQKLKLEYVMFSAADHTAEFPASGIDELTLKTFWNDNKIVQQQFRSQNSVSAEFLYVDLASMSMDEAMNLSGGNDISREAALDYFQRNRDTLMRQVPPEKQHLLHIDAGANLEEVVSPFQVLEETIKKSMLLDGVLAKALEEAKAAGAEGNIEEIAKRHQLGYMKVENLEKAPSITTLQRFGFNAFNTLFSAPEGQVASSISEEQGTRYFYRLNKKVSSRLPEFDEIREKLLVAYIDSKSTEKARKRSQEANQWLNDQMNAAIKPLQDELLSKAAAEAERRITEMRITKEDEKVQERTRAQAGVRQPLDDERRKLRPQLFDRYVKENNLKVISSDYFEFQPQRADRSQITDIEESRRLFLQTNYYINSMSPGDVTPIVLEDPATKSFFLVKLAEKKDPDFDSLTAVDLAQARAQLKQIREAGFLLRWRYAEIAKRFQLETTN